MKLCAQCKKRKVRLNNPTCKICSNTSLEKYLHRKHTYIIEDYYMPSSVRDLEYYSDYAVNVNKIFFARKIDETTEAKRLIDTDYSIHFHCFIPEDIVNLIEWFSKNVQPITILEGPKAEAGSDEFHLLLRVEG